MSEDGSPLTSILSFLEQSALPRRQLQARAAERASVLTRLWDRDAGPGRVPREHGVCCLARALCWAWPGPYPASRGSPPTCTQRLLPSSCPCNEGSASPSQRRLQGHSLELCCGAKTIWLVHRCQCLEPHKGQCDPPSPALPPRVNGGHPSACSALVPNASHSRFAILLSNSSHPITE